MEIKELLIPGWRISKTKRTVKLEKDEEGCRYIILFSIPCKSYSAKFGGMFSRSWENPYQLKIEEHMMIHNLMKAFGWLQ